MNYPSYIGSFRILFVYGKSYSIIYSTVDKPKIAPTLSSSLSPHDNIFLNLQRCGIIFNCLGKIIPSGFQFKLFTGCGTWYGILSESGLLSSWK